MTRSEKNRRIFFILTAILAVCAAFVIGLMIKGCSYGQAAGYASELSSYEYKADIDPDAEDPESISSESNENSKIKGIRIPGYPYIRIPCGETEVRVSLLNPEGNPCYFVFEIVLQDTEEVLFQSKQVPPGKAINRLVLTRPLKKGEYDAVIRISTFSVENGGAMNGANVRTRIIAE